MTKSEQLIKIEVLAEKLPIFEKHIILFLRMHLSERQIGKMEWQSDLNIGQKVIHYYKLRALKHLKEIAVNGFYIQSKRKSKYENIQSKNWEAYTTSPNIISNISTTIEFKNCQNKLPTTSIGGTAALKSDQ